ncbi:chromatin complexes subunit BAP18-like [Hyposmocoma kahamanoa]|uniref:chromatin complexes subunit BAP18-like n=1 Tax=Hyposmocoma kahamanoa TaxID=1477025 RepID=UPI000E6D8C6D|nr:chromatin complexes subunit BAP18-like [Hyposmocoma kahamanoa]
MPASNKYLPSECEYAPPKPFFTTEDGETVGEIFTEAGAAFNKLAEMTMLLHPMAEQLPGSQSKTPVKRKVVEERVVTTQAPTASQQQHNVHLPPMSQQVTLNMLNARESEMDVEGLSNEVKLEFESSTEEVIT